MPSKTIQQGAEGIITLSNNQVLKNRVKKSYRHPELDEKIRKLRTRSEAKILDKLNNVLPVPKLIETDNKENITMQYIQGQKLSEHLEELDYKTICKQIAQLLTDLHNKDIIHGDLTTSNMIYVKNKNNKTDKTSSSHNNLSINNKNNPKVYLIDFGLSYHSHKLEDKAVDLHLLKQALEAKHFKIAEQTINIILNNYKPHRYKEILEQLKKVESRGRYKERC